MVKTYNIHSRTSQDFTRRQFSASIDFFNATENRLVIVSDKLTPDQSKYDNQRKNEMCMFSREGYLCNSVLKVKYKIKKHVHKHTFQCFASQCECEDHLGEVISLSENVLAFCH